MRDRISVSHRRTMPRTLVVVGFALALLVGLLAGSPGMSSESAGPSASANSQFPLTMIFQKLVSPDPTYTGVADTYISLYEQDTNFGHLGTMRLHTGSGSRERLLIKFDLSRITPPVTITEAKLYLYAWYRSGPYKVTGRVYPLRRPWNEMEVTWRKPTADSFWTVPGCNDPAADYDPSKTATAELNFTEMWYSWDVTSMVQSWVGNPASNNGMLVIAEGISNQYQFRTSEIPAESLRPYLEVHYTAGVPTPSATATRTATTSPTATTVQTPTATRTASPSPTITPIRSATPTLTPTITLTPTPSPTPVTQVLQQHILPDETYSGAADTFLSRHRPDTAWDGDDSLRLSGRDGGSERILLRFDLQGRIPATAIIHSAKVGLFAWSRLTFYGIRVSAFDILRPWQAQEATWNVAASAQPWMSVGCEELDVDRSAVAAASRFVYFTNYFYDWDVTESVRRWHASPSSNHGLLFIGHEVDQEIRFRSAEWRVLSQRPRLIVTYTVP